MIDGTDFGFICIAICLVFIAVRVRRAERKIETLQRWRGVGGKVRDE